MRVFIIGGTSSPDPAQAQALDEFCTALGQALGDSTHQIVLCSCQPKSADRAVLEGLGRWPGRRTPEKLIVHRPDDAPIREEWEALRRRLGLVEPKFHDHRGPDFRTAEGTGIASFESLRLAFLLCQIQALEHDTVVLAIGGQNEGSAVLSLAVARAKGLAILPFRFLGGAAERTFAQVEGELKARLDAEDLERLSRPGEGAAAVGLLEKLSGARIIGPARIFLSYPWRRADYADLVEAILRRLDRVSVFRDERDVPQGERIDARVEDEIRSKCNVFLAIWCREYVESPYCHDELELWVRLRKRENLFLLRFDATRPVWRAVRRRPDDRETFYAKWPLVGTDRETSADRAKVTLGLREMIDVIEGRRADGPGTRPRGGR